MKYISDFEFGIKGLDVILPKGGVLKRGSVVAIEGPLGTFKSSLARGFLAYGLATGKTSQNMFKKPESVLLICLNDHPVLRANSEGKPIIKRLPKTFQENINFTWDNLELCEQNTTDNYLKDLNKTSMKSPITLWKNNTKRKDSRAYLIEVDFKSGAIFPEEFVQIIRDVFRLHKKWKEVNKHKYDVSDITRVVLDDVNLIGLSYPFLRNSKSTEDQFLPFFVRIMRNIGVSLVITGTTGESLDANDSVSQACSLADTVLSCRLCEIYGDRYVTVQSEGLLAVHAKEHQTPRDPVPALIRMDDEDANKFKVDTDFLQGLVGFQAGDIHRPGISLHLFQENELIHSKYNKGIETFLKSAFAVPFPYDQNNKGCFISGMPQKEIRKDSPSVTISTFNSEMSEDVHDSIGVLKEKPFDKTVVITLDEFWGTGVADVESPGTVQKLLCQLNKPEGESNFYIESRYAYNEKDPYTKHIRPYYANLLLLAYRIDLFGETGPLCNSWSELNNCLRDKTLPAIDNDPCPINKRFWYDRSAEETLACALMSAIISGSIYNPINKKDTSIPHMHWKTCGNYIRNILIMSNYRKDSMLEELRAFSQLLIHSKNTNDITTINSMESGFQQNKITTEYVLPPNSAVYLCWYSQLRELIARYPLLASKIGICKVPGGSFRGDWFIGIERGSVSENLGRTVVDMLTDSKEEYKRFAKGVGLPIHDKYLTSRKTKPRFLGWPGTTKVSLNSIIDIYKSAYSRASIPGYKQFHSILSMISHQIGPEYNESPPTKKALTDMVSRIPDQIELLSKNESTGNRDIFDYCEQIHLQQNNAKNYFNLGYALSELNKLEEAIDSYRKAILLMPDDADIYYNLGLILSELREWDKAVHAYKRAIHLKPDDADAFFNLGLVLTELNKWDKAVDAYRKVIRLKPHYNYIYFELGFALYSQGKWNEAADAFSKALRIKSNDVDTHYNLGLTLIELNKWKEAAIEFRNTIRLENQNTDAHFNLGIALVNINKLDDAIDEFNKVIEMDSDNSYAIYAIACIYLRKNMKEKGLRWLLKSVNNGFSDSSLFEEDGDLDPIREELEFKELFDIVKNRCEEKKRNA